MAATPIFLSNIGPRPIDLYRDSGQVLELLDLVFGTALDSRGRRLLNSETMLTAQPMLLTHLTYLFNNVPAGYVWEEQGRIVGNVSIMPTKSPGRYILANVAVHPAYRRRGIARLLLQEVLQHLSNHQSHAVLLQVEQQNQQAITLYRSLGFAALGATTTWILAPGRLRQLPIPTSERSPDRFGDYLLRPLRSHEWRTAWRLDENNYPYRLEPLPQQVYKNGWWQWLENFFNGRQAENWVAVNLAGRILGLAAILSQWGRPHELTLRVDPAGRGHLERILFAKLLRRLHYLAHRHIQIDHPAGDDHLNQLFHEANFTPKRTLLLMRFDPTPNT